MNSIRKNQLQKELEKMTAMSLQAKESLLIVEYLSQEENDEYYNYEKRSNVFLYFSRFIFWQNTVIELSKLFLEREKYSILKLIKKLKKDGEYSELNISNEKISGWILKIEDCTDELANLKEQRDKVYAHEDDRDDKIFNKVSIQGTKVLLELAFDVINNMRKSLGFYPLETTLINSSAKNLNFWWKGLFRRKEIT